jgi:DNA-binding NarL/FixJ family response regulator
MARSHILCIEDDADTAELIQEVLQDEDYKVTVATNGMEGLEALSFPPDLVLCDIDMPTLSGLELLKQARASGKLPNKIPFIFITAFGHRSLQLEARRLGCDDYITKPLDFELLIEIIRHRLSRGQEPERTSKPEFELTAREVQTLLWVARGKSSAEIAIILDVTERTVNFHIDNVIRKMGVATRVQAAVKATMLGLLSP